MALYSKVAIDNAISKATKELGYNELRPNQIAAITRFVNGRDVFVCLPTGSGKSLCYCLLPTVFDKLKACTKSSIVVVVSPLISLMKDQVRAMLERNVSAVYTGSIDDNTEADITEGKYQLVFFSPEALLCEERWLDMLMSPLYQENLVAFVVDEAHCVKKWYVKRSCCRNAFYMHVYLFYLCRGDTFRVAFSHLGDIRSVLPEHVHVMALTATATKDTRLAVSRILGMVQPNLILQVPDRPNIKYVVHRTLTESLEDIFMPLAKEIQQKRVHMDRVIIYCTTYDNCSSMYLFLRARLRKEMTEPIGSRDLAQFRLVDMFTACTPMSVKEDILQSFCDVNGILRVVVATVAFGMGLDCPNVRRIIHWGLSADLEQYVQETGRAGRDNVASLATLYLPPMSLRFADQRMKEYCNNVDKCRRLLMLEQFKDTPTNPCSDDINYSKGFCCDVCDTLNV